MFAITPEGEEVWALHLEFKSASAVDRSHYPVSAETADDIRSYTEHVEAELALQLILAVASPTISHDVQDRARQLARRLFNEEPAEEVDAWVDGWIAWHPGCGFEPPYWN